MTRLLRRTATPAITGLFLVSLVSGVALFLGVGQSAFHEMHELLSLVLIVPAGLHLWRDWRPMMGYMGRTPMTVALSLSVVAALGFALPAMIGTQPAGGPPQFALAHVLLTHSPAEVAPLLDTTAEDLSERLAAAGFTVADPDTPLTAIAAASGQNEVALARALLPAS